ncbi:MAG: ABC transporter permease [Deltaproteobacteria bacterium]|nr:ABC transporter permease [Deltaproteobacteria bacterium]
MISSSSGVAQKDIRIIKSQPSFRNLLTELWRSKRLVFAHAVREIKIRYTPSVLGIAWVLIQPVLVTVAFAFLFSRFSNLASRDIPYPLFTFVALLPWQLMTSGISRSTTTIVDNKHLFTKVHFPVIILPLAGTIVSLLDFFVCTMFVCILFIYYSFTPSANIVIFPLMLFLTLYITAGIGVMFSAFTVKTRDIGHALPFGIQLSLFLTPIAYDAHLVPEKWQMIYSLNPLVSVCLGFRWTLLGADIPLDMFLISITVGFIAATTGFIYFNKARTHFSDVL